MKVIIDNNGQTCNKFWCYIQPLIRCIRTKKKAVIFYHDAQIDYFPNLLRNDYFIYPLYNKFLNRRFGILRYTSRVRECFKSEKHDYYPLLFKHFGNILEYSWDSRFEPIPQEYIPEIKRVFRPDESIVSYMDSLFKTVRKNVDIIIGVHVRRGDYCTFFGGKYFYSFVQYVTLCKYLMSRFPGKRVMFFIASNESIDSDALQGIKWFSVCNGEALVVKDLYGLSICDYIVGPPSSFSRWASFYGEVPISFIMDMEYLNNICFRTMANYGTYTNGDTIEFDF